MQFSFGEIIAPIFNEQVRQRGDEARDKRWLVIPANVSRVGRSIVDRVVSRYSELGEPGIHPKVGKRQSYTTLRFIA
jgi:hypothetical protein